MRFLVGNLTHGVTVGDLARLFGEYGTVAAVELGPNPLNPVTWAGYAHVEMPEEAESEQAWRALNRREFAGRPLRVECMSEASWA